MAETLATYESRNLNDPAQELFSNSKITRIANEGENNFAVEYPCILKRISITVAKSTGGATFDETSGTFDETPGLFDNGGGTGAWPNTFTLPDDIVSIKRVTWKGFKLDPLPQRNFREVFQNASQQGRPFWYVFNNVGQNLIQLFPTPNEALPINSGSTLFDSHGGLFDDASGLFDAATGINLGTQLWGANIPNCFIVEYYQAPDFDTAIIPPYIRRRLLKSYVMRGCFNMEGQGQNRKASAYAKEKWRMLKKMYGELLGDLHNKPRKLVVNGISSSYYFPGLPILPINRFGISVDSGE